MAHLTEHWSTWIHEQETRGQPYVLVTVLGARGSTPRDSGTKMLVTTDRTRGTIGGGTLEFAAQRRAHDLLAAGEGSQALEHFPLGEKLGQCCGGSTTLLFECFVPQRETVYLFGAGHVGRALAPILAGLPLRLNWIDTRREAFPDRVPDGVITHCPEEALDLVARAPANSYFVIMTHEHPLDFALVNAVLNRGDAAYAGVIGSASKARRFRLRLQHRGHSEASINSVRCPIGLPAVPGKRPQEIAVAIAAELIAHYHARRAASERIPGPSWKSLQAALGTSITDKADTEPR